MNGLELCARIRQSLGDECFVMLVTARDGADDLTAALAAGADDYIVKPVNRRDFQARVAIAERRVALSRAKNAAVEEATRMRWLAGIGQTVLALQHEINNPLAALFGLLGELSVENGLPTSLEGEVRGAWEQTHRIAGVVERLSKMDGPTTVELVPGLAMLALSPVVAARAR
jgi:DNA-binding response OmpR family regulator